MKMLSECELAELLSFLKADTRADVKAGATECVLGLSANRDGCLFLGSKPELLRAVWALTSDPSIAIVKDVYFIFINLSAGEELHQVLVSDLDVLPLLCKNLLDPTFPFSDQICTVLSNLSRSEQTCPSVYKVLQDKVGVSKLVEIFCSENFNPKANFHFLGPLLSNLSQLEPAREEILDHDRCVVQRLLPFTQFEGSVVRRGGVIGTLRNCCFDHKHHEWLLTEVDLLPFLLLPLAGPEELREDEIEGLPLDLQYLPDDKEREADPDLRKMLLETLLLLCATARGRQILKDKQVYPLMRELHQWESEEEVKRSAEKLIQVLIGDEPQPGMENLMELKIPEEVEKQLIEADLQELNQELNQD